jgi:CRISPR-associated endonuclease/helicase Cas3
MSGSGERTGEGSSALGDERLLWAKTDRQAQGDADRWHPLVCHVIDVAHVAGELLREAVSRRVIERACAAMHLDRAEAIGWLSFWVGLHDLGKASPAFQAKWTPGKQRLADRGFEFHHPAHGSFEHGSVSAVAIEQLLCSRFGIARPVAVRIGQAVGGHHGEVPTDGELLHCARSRRQMGSATWHHAREAVVAHLVRALGIGPWTGAPDALHEDHGFFAFLAGFTSVADWLGSMSEVFGFAPEVASLAEYALKSRKLATSVLQRTGWRRAVPVAASDFVSLFGRPPWPLHEAIASATATLQAGSLVIVEAPMGEGKTEGSLMIAETLAARDGQDGVYIGLPTQATSNQMFGRVKRHLDRTRPESRSNLQLVHGASWLHEGFGELRAVFDRSEDGAVVAEGWFLPKKRALLAPYAVGTVDQALMGVLRTRHALVRLYGLAGKTVILDEVHAYDTYTGTLLERLVAWLAAMGTSVVVLSATLPSATRRRLAEAYSSGAAPLANVPYPRITTVGRDGGVRVLPFEGRRGPMRVALERTGPALADVARDLVQRSKDGGCVAWILNTVARAQAAYRAVAALRDAGELAADTNVSLLHARFPYEDRAYRERDADRRFGPPGEGRQRPLRAILIGTQVLEQSLDLDFDLMVTDLAPIDLVLQRAGRLHRHRRDARPAALAEPRLLLSRCEAEEAPCGPAFGTSAFVYDESVLLASWLALRDRDAVVLADDIEPLVERVYDGARDPLDGPIGERLRNARAEAQREHDRDWREAENRLLGPPVGCDDILGATGAPFAEDDPDVHRSLQALTRLGAPSIDAVCLFDVGGRSCLDPAGEHSVDLDKPPNLATTKALLLRATSLSHRGIVQHLFGVPGPAGWTKSAALRHHRALVFGASPLDLGGRLVSLDPELGVEIHQNRPEET